MPETHRIYSKKGLYMGFFMFIPPLHFTTYCHLSWFTTQHTRLIAKSIQAKSNFQKKQSFSCFKVLINGSDFHNAIKSSCNYLNNWQKCSRRIREKYLYLKKHSNFTLKALKRSLKNSKKYSKTAEST